MTSQPLPGHGAEDRDAQFASLYSTLSPRLRRFFRSAGCSGDESWDLAQVTLLRAYKGLDSFRHEASERTWVLKIAARVLSNYLRSRAAAKRGAHVVPLDGVAEPAAGAVGVPGAPAGRGDGDPLALLLDQEGEELVSVALEELPPQMRQCMLLYVMQDLKYREIAVVLRISIGTVKSQIHEARQRLRVRLGPHFGVGGR